MENGQQEVQPSLTLVKTWRRLPEDISQIDTLQRSYFNKQSIKSQRGVQTPGGKGSQDKGESSHYTSNRRTTEPGGEYSYFLRLTRSKPTRIPSGFT
ncbi:hypothetical protein O181_005490 [Austropuccinia psidii MF-1]|uniref:Uncharacterized protein n=1 Tax=Austropuccinia psidii MF-1 TaxID=1389203 RepID=A0A9Q3GFW6_9BASI|nr:hypothetical protein [Austropuccinia psidii MF-1]